MFLLEQRYKTESVSITSFCSRRDRNSETKSRAIRGRKGRLAGGSQTVWKIKLETSVSRVEQKQKSRMFYETLLETGTITFAGESIQNVLILDDRNKVCDVSTPLTIKNVF